MLSHLLSVGAVEAICVSSVSNVVLFFKIMDVTRNNPFVADFDVLPYAVNLLSYSKMVAVTCPAVFDAPTFFISCCCSASKRLWVAFVAMPDVGISVCMQGERTLWPQHGLCTINFRTFSRKTPFAIEAYQVFEPKPKSLSRSFYRDQHSET